ncbi:hypothetical protein HK102_013365 [Quaeritorhiza haematococci]|nr:hypothetical protein HK102_013365 [Quaeritorhiza haematococci]
MIRENTFALLVALASSSSLLTADARSVYSSSSLSRREVPQEHSHDIILNEFRRILDLQPGRGGFPDPVFGVLANPAAATALSQTNLPNNIKSDAKCLQQNLADQAITTCKAVRPGDANCIATAVKFRALERNTQRVGLKSDICTATPQNQELVGIQQHQDPASQNAKAENAEIEKAVAKRLKELGLSTEAAVTGALETTTFAPGDVNDPTAKGNSCDAAPGRPNAEPVVASQDGVDPVTGIAFKQGDVIDCITLATVDNGVSKRVPAATREELLAAAGGAASGTQPGAGAGANPGNGGAPATPTNPLVQTITTTVFVTSTAACTAPASPPPQMGGGAPPANGNGGNGGNGDNLQRFTGTLNGVTAPAVTQDGNQFQVAGNARFNNIQNALVRSCDVQNNQCANAFNGQRPGATNPVSECNRQQQECIALARQ